MKIRIVNKKRFVKSIVIITLSLFLIFGITVKSYSKKEVKYVDKCIYSGDTLWSIASEELRFNEYFKEKDIRDIIYEIQKINNLKDSDLKEGEVLVIPTL